MPLATLSGVREAIVSFMAMDDLWRRRVPDTRGWRVPRVGFLPAVDVLVGALVALAVGAGGLLLAALQDRLDVLGVGDVIVVIALAVVLSFRRVAPVTSAALITVIWVIGAYATPYMAANWVSTLAVFFSYDSLMGWARTRRLAWGSMLAVFVVIMGWVALTMAFGNSLTKQIEAINPDSNGEGIIYLVLTYVIINVTFVIGAALAGQVSWLRARDLAEVRRQAATIERQRTQLAEQAVLDERLRIAREMHDSVAHHVSVVGIHAAGARRALDIDPDLARDALATVESESRAVVTEIRSLLGSLRAGGEPRARLGLADLDRLCEEQRRASVRLLRVGDDSMVGPLLGHTCYRIVQESLNNVEAHSSATEVTVSLRCNDDEVEVEITDNGRPIRSGPSTGVGIVGMSERVEVLGGTIEVGPRKVGGWRVRAVMPLRQGEKTRAEDIEDGVD
ncbi:sensor histidine kinase [Cutibacterium equinum]|uniref:histidine kinase n=1 Tax=Cutibacterium equinum TaxID=3016342 RepID=A0ABY7R053_9ACTN|nr:sensor histidine kinase [Cutibacterium equinum]WCC80680.1 sensor histidine kinase [Cutibacterium equinum]